MYAVITFKIKSMINDYISLTKSIVLSNIDKKEFDVFLFGSRANGTFHEMSDIDIGILGKVALDVITKGKLEDAIYESIVPFKVDIIDFNNAAEDFKKIAMKNIIYWNKREA